MDDLMYVWADGTHCVREDLDLYLLFMDDDYQCVDEKEFYELHPQEETEDELYNSPSATAQDSSTTFTYESVINPSSGR